MSKIKAPLFSLSAIKALGKRIIFVKSKGRNIAKSYFIPGNPNTPDQQNLRSDFKFLSDLYISGLFGPWALKAWEYKAKILSPGAHGRNMFMGFYLSLDPSLTPGSFVALHPLILLPNITIKVHASHTTNIRFKIVRGDNSGFEEIQMAVFPGLNSFGPYPINPKSICRFDYPSGPIGGESGYFPLGGSWWT